MAEAVAKAIATAATRLLSCEEASSHGQASPRTEDTRGLKGVPLADGDKGGGGGHSNDSRDSSGGKEGGGGKGMGVERKGKKEQKKWKTEDGGSGLEEDEESEEGGEGGDVEDEGGDGRSRLDTSLEISQKNEERGKGWAHEAGAGLGNMLELFCVPAGREGQKMFCMP